MTNNRTEQARIAVAKGATLLDQKFPGWHRKIDLDKLNLAQGTVCVLGQLFDKPERVRRWRTVFLGQKMKMADVMEHMGWSRAQAIEVRCEANYDAGRILLNLDWDGCIEYGFNTKGGRGEVSYHDLDLAWAELIRGRQAQDVLAERHPELMP